MAVWWARRRAPRFPDGQVYLDLHGFDERRPDERRPALTAGEALTRLLRLLGGPQLRLPPDTDGQTALLRSLVAERRMVMVLDNAVAPIRWRPWWPTRPASR